MQIRLGTLAEAVQVVQEIDEFAHKETVASMAQRLAGKRDLILIAEEHGQLLGF
ncbi:GNAT family N-acetyltransferase, partial [Vibrio vulnificus]|nr:GNAT family N-acetyltransferase [Vibrio vulnificus]